jgi:uncharacterized protein (DUF1810 family)
MPDQFDLQRFVDAQQAVYQQVLAELRSGRKRSHWMWFIFPQIKGLGHTATAQKFSISSLAEASAYLEHNLLGPRLRECSRLVAALEGCPIDGIFGYPDYLKFHSSMTLFAAATTDNQIFNDCLRKYFSGQADQSTMTRL